MSNFTGERPFFSGMSNTRPFFLFHSMWSGRLDICRLVDLSFSFPVLFLRSEKYGNPSHKPLLKCNRVYCSYKLLKREAEWGLKIFMNGLKKYRWASAPTFQRPCLYTYITFTPRKFCAFVFVGKR